MTSLLNATNKRKPSGTRITVSGKLAFLTRSYSSKTPCSPVATSPQHLRTAASSFEVVVRPSLRPPSFPPLNSSRQSRQIRAVTTRIHLTRSKLEMSRYGHAWPQRVTEPKQECLPLRHTVSWPCTMGQADRGVVSGIRTSRSSASTRRNR